MQLSIYFIVNNSVTWSFENLYINSMQLFIWHVDPTASDILMWKELIQIMT